MVNKISLCILTLALSGCVSNSNIRNDVGQEKRGFLDQIFSKSITYSEAVEDGLLTYKERLDLGSIGNLIPESKQQYLVALNWMANWLRVPKRLVDSGISWRVKEDSNGILYEPFFSSDVIGEGVGMLAGSRLTNNGERFDLRVNEFPDN